MELNNLACGDNIDAESQSSATHLDDNIAISSVPAMTEAENPEALIFKDESGEQQGITQNDNENNLKERIKQCRNIIESLKIELNQEKSRLEKESKNTQDEDVVRTDPESSLVDFSSPAFCTCVDDKLISDDNLVEYEKQLQRYQNTLNMAQLEKKNAIRKHMIAKAYKLKLLEVENQCNIELLRVKQSLQCLEPLQMIVKKWKTSNDDATYDLDNYDLIPMYPELNARSGSDVSSTVEDSERKVTPSNCLNDTIYDV